jgi:hypothetical protein
LNMSVNRIFCKKKKPNFNIYMPSTIKTDTYVLIY